jgi:hypothetical protein
VGRRCQPDTAAAAHDASADHDDDTSADHDDAPAGADGRTRGESDDHDTSAGHHHAASDDDAATQAFQYRRA